MNRSRHAILVPLFAVLALLLALVGNAPAAFNHAATEPHYGNFLLQQSEASASEWLQLADPIKENGEWIYDSALGVPVYVRQNPWTRFDPLGLSERNDDDGFEWSDRDHHKVPRAVARDAGWDKSAKDVFNKSKISTPNGHNNRAHGHYNKEIGAEMAEFLQKNAPDGLGGMSASDQRELAEKFVNKIDNTKNKFIKEFNKKVTKGPNAIDKWFNNEGKDIVLKSTGKAASKGGKIITGIGKLDGFAKKVPGLNAVILVGGAVVGFANGQEVGDVGLDMVKGITGADLVEDAYSTVNDKLTNALTRPNNPDTIGNMRQRLLEDGDLNE